MRYLMLSVLAGFALTAPVIASDVKEDATGARWEYTSHPPGGQWQRTLDVLWDNGPLVNCPGCGAGGADESQVQTSLGMSTLGFGNQLLLNYGVADDFTIPSNETWDLETILTFGYQTGSTTASTMTGVSLQIYDGPPGAGGNLIWADPSALTGSDWANIYRVTETTTGATNRPVMVNVADLGTSLSLGEGTYWLAWSTDGLLTSGPWAPPITINGETSTGNGLQSTDGNYAIWDPCLDTGTLTPQGLPFILRGQRHGAGPHWVSLDGSPPGTEAELELDVTVSDVNRTVFDLIIHGLWVEPREGPDHTVYQKIAAPGIGSFTMNELGAPDLPVLCVDLAVATDASMVQLVSADPIQTMSFQNILVWPQPIEGLNDSLGTGEQFQIDQGIYSLTDFWPQRDGVQWTQVGKRVGIPCTGCVMYPVQWNPGTGEMLVRQHIRYEISHPGLVLTPDEEINRDRALQASHHFLNWPIVRPFFPVNWLFFRGHYLFIHPAAYGPNLASLKAQKWARGYWVTTMTTEVIGNTCAQIRAAINAWYAATPIWRSHYCLLVGDVGAIPLCTAPVGGIPTDDLYGSTNGDDLDEEVYVGRFSVDDEADVRNQVYKTLRYESFPPPFSTHFDDVTLAAHKQGAPAKYVGAQEAVRTAVYTVPPTFWTRYGHIPGVTDASVSAQINAGRGVVCYRGHGSNTAWTTWNTGNESYSTADVIALTNNPRNPVVWSFSCLNQNLSVEDCIGEVWMEQVNDGSVAHYGSTEPSYTDQNHELDYQIFQAVYRWGLTTHAHAIEYAERQMATIVGSDNAWMYLLLGDPEMQIRRRNPWPWVIVLPPLEPSPAPFPIDIQVLDDMGLPVSDVLVSMFKPGGRSESPEVFANRYTNDEGMATLDADSLTHGWLYYSARDSLGNAVLDSVLITEIGVAEADPLMPISLTARPTVVRKSTHLGFGRPLTEPALVTMFDVGGRAVRTFEAEVGWTGVDWNARDGSGHLVAPGIYFVRMTSPEATLSVRIVVVR